MKAYILLFPVIILFEIAAEISAQDIQFYPKTNVINLDDGCTGVYMKYSESKTGEIDSIKINPGFNTSICYEDSTGETNCTETVMFLVNKKNNNYEYELYFCRQNQNKILIPPDSLFNIDYPDYYLKLIVKKDNSIIDSLSQKFHSAWGLGIEEDSQSSLPVHYNFLKNYPNPFNPSTTIEYEILSSCEINLSVYNILGRLITTLKDGYETKGIYRKLWNAHSLESGVYFIVLKNNSGIIVTKSILLK